MENFPSFSMTRYNHANAKAQLSYASLLSRWHHILAELANFSEFIATFKSNTYGVHSFYYNNSTTIWCQCTTWNQKTHRGNGLVGRDSLESRDNSRRMLGKIHWMTPFQHLILHASPNTAPMSSNTQVTRNQKSEITLHHTRNHFSLLPTIFLRTS